MDSWYLHLICIIVFLYIFFSFLELNGIWLCGKLYLFRSNIKGPYAIEDYISKAEYGEDGQWLKCLAFAGWLYVLFSVFLLSRTLLGEKKSLISFDFNSSNQFPLMDFQALAKSLFHCALPWKDEFELWILIDFSSGRRKESRV